MKKIIALILLIAAVSLQSDVLAQKKNKNYDAARNLEIFSAIYKNLDMMFVDSLDASKVIGTGIRAMLASLDRYTEYYAPEQVKDLKTMLTGKYAGVGAVVRKSMKTGNVCFEEPYAGMPAQEAGLKKGDEILSIDDSTMVGKSTEYVSSHLRGDPGTTFLLKIRRPTTGKTMKMKITRRAIQMPAVPYYGMLDDKVGYINLNSFTDECSKDVRRAFIELRQGGMKGLLFDLRNNGGGSLQEALKIVNMFVPKDIMLLETKGKIARSNNKYMTTAEPIDTVMPIVVLVNGNSASASEITSGSLQDLDRAVIFGTRTYGKGLVQLPIDLPHNASMKLTTSKYYIPSGRCIQAYVYDRQKGGAREHIPDSLTHVFYTRNGREVRDGGGINPDIVMKADSLPNIAFYLSQSGLDSTEVQNTWIVDYIAKHPQIAKPEEFHLTDADWQDFKQCVIASGFKYDRETTEVLDELVKVAKFEGYYDDAVAEFDALKAKLSHNLERELDNNADVIRHIIEGEIVAAYWYQAGRIAHMNTYDKQLLEAKRLVMSGEEYERILKTHPLPLP